MNAQYIPGWRRSVQGRSIDLFHSPQSHWGGLNRPIVMIGGVHGDEPEGIHLAESTLSWLLHDQQNETNVSVPWILITCLNPDGHASNQRGNAHGVDINRNYPASNWASTASSARYYPGPQPGSEPETQAVIDIVTSTHPRLLIHCHSWKPCIVCSGDNGRKDAQYLATSSGYEVVATIGYDTPGSLSQYGMDQNTPVICIEEQERELKETSWLRFASGIKNIFYDNSDRR